MRRGNTGQLPHPRGKEPNAKMHGAANAAVIAATIIIVIVAIVAAYVTATEVEKGIERSGGGKKGPMASSVYGKSFADPPRGSLQTAALGAGPGYQFHPQKVAGASFAHLE